jgi:hypothetical protein
MIEILSLITTLVTKQLGPRTTRTEISRPVSEDKSARKRGLVGLYVKTTRRMKRQLGPSIIIVVLLIFFNKIDGNHKDTV